MTNSSLAAGLGDHPFTNRQRLEPSGLQIGPQIIQEHCRPAGLFDVSGGVAVNAASPGAPIGSDPVPPNQEESRVTHEVV